MSVRPGAPYSDRIEQNGRVLIYEGHDLARIKGGPDPKKSDQPDTTPAGTLTQNGLFWNAAKAYREHRSAAEKVKVYEKIRTGIWVYAGLFDLVDASKQEEHNRKVFKFTLQLSKEQQSSISIRRIDLEHDRLIPTLVKIEVWKRDKGRCVICGNKENLHFDHILPFSKGGTSLLAKNIQLLCATHNLQKRDKIQ